MRKVITSISVISLSFFIILSVSSEKLYANNSVVTGKNNSEIDVKSVQEAVDKGGTVLLKGTFDFGPKGQVTIKNDVEISGESDAKGNPLTKITGGFWCFHSKLPTTEPSISAPGPKVKIKHIHFDGATWTPMHFSYTSGAEVSGNKITNVHPFAVPQKWSGGETLLMTAGAFFGTFLANKEKIIPGAVTGSLIFVDNKVDLRCEKPEITMGQGAFFLYTWGAEIEVRGNRIRNVSRNSIESLDNYLDEQGRGSVLIAENNIVTPSVGIPFPTGSTPNGIIVGWFIDPKGGADPARNSRITVVRNFVQTNGKTSVGIASLANGTSILGNRVEVKGGTNAKAIVQVGSKAFIARNKVDGLGEFALNAVPLKGVQSNGNTFAWNDVTEFQASAADFLCVGNDNVLIGTECKVVDKGNDNLMLTQY